MDRSVDELRGASAAREVEVRGGWAALRADRCTALASHQHVPGSGSRGSAPFGALRPPRPLLAAASGVPRRRLQSPPWRPRWRRPCPLWLSLGPALPFQRRFGFSAAFPPLILPGGRGRRLRKGSLHPQTVASVRGRVSLGRHSCRCRPRARVQAQRGSRWPEGGKPPRSHTQLRGPCGRSGRGALGP